MTGTGIGPKGMCEEDKAKIVATREAQIAKGGYGFGARVNALLAKNASAQTKAWSPTCCAPPIRAASCMA